MSSGNDESSATEKLGRLIIETFRLNGRLLSAGDQLVADIRLTSARWQVLGAIALSETAEPVARHARSMGLNRQGVQRIVNELAAEGLVAFRDNPHHRRAKLVVLTEAGHTAYQAAERRRRPWTAGLAAEFSEAEIDNALHVVTSLRRHLERES